MLPVYHKKRKCSPCLLRSSFPLIQWKTARARPLKEVLSMWICIIGSTLRSSVYPSIHLPLIYPLTGSQEGWACPSSLWAKGRRTRQLVSGQAITSNVNCESPIRLSPNACLWTLAGIQNTQITHANAGENTQTQRRICDVGGSGCEVDSAKCCSSTAEVVHFERISATQTGPKHIIF